MDRALRRFYVERWKRRSRSRIEARGYYNWDSQEDNKSNIGKEAITRARCSSGYCCGNPRKYRKEKLTIQELKHLDRFKDGLEEYEI